MLKELASFLHRSGSTGNLGQFVLVSDSMTDGGFLIHHYITQALQDGHLTYLISFAQSLIHYHSIALKLGVNLSKLEESGNFVFIDCLTHLLSGGGLADDSASSKKDGIVKMDSSTASGAGSRIVFSLDSKSTLRELYQKVYRSIESGALSEPDRPICLVIDDLSVLLSLGVQLGEVVSFISYCRQMLLSPQGPCNGTGCLVAMVHCEGADSDEPEQLLRKHLLHACHLSLHVQGLSTGYSKDVHGNLTVEWRDPGGGGGGSEGTASTTRSTSPAVKCVQYKLSDRNVQLFAKGTSAAVL